MLDLHIHMHPGRKDTPEVFKEKTMAAGVTGGAVFGLHPEGYQMEANEDQRWQARAEQIMEFCSRAPGFRPVFHSAQPASFPFRTVRFGHPLPPECRLYTGTACPPVPAGSHIPYNSCRQQSLSPVRHSH